MFQNFPPAAAMAASSIPPDQSPTQQQASAPRSYAQVTAPTRVSSSAPAWFKFNHIPLPTRTLSVVDSEPACLFTPMEIGNRPIGEAIRACHHHEIFRRHTLPPRH